VGVSSGGVILLVRLSLVGPFCNNPASICLSSLLPFGGGRLKLSMFDTPFDSVEQGPALEAHLLGQVDFGLCLALQERLVQRIADRDDGQICLLLCEHPAVVTIGRGGSPGDVARDARVLRSRQIDVRWVKRGGPALVHAPGQLAVYLIAPLRWHGLSVGEYLKRLQSGVFETLGALGVRPQTRAGRHGVFGRTGQLAVLGATVRDGVTFHGAFVNVAPPMGLFRLVQSDPDELASMSCLVAELGKPAKMTAVRAELVRRLADVFGCDRYHLHTGHPMLRRGCVKQR